MKIIGIGLCLIGIGIIVNALAVQNIIIDNTADIPRRVPKGKPAGKYDPDEDWEFPED